MSKHLPESVEQKGWRLFAAGAVRRDGRRWRVQGDNSEYTVERGRCSCPARCRCSHEVAVEYASGIASAPRGVAEVPVEVLAALLRLEIEAGDGERRMVEAARQDERWSA